MDTWPDAWSQTSAARSQQLGPSIQEHPIQRGADTKNRQAAKKGQDSKGTKYSIGTYSLFPITAFYDIMWSGHHSSSWIWSLWHRQSRINLIFPQARANSSSSLAVFPAMGHPDLTWEVRRRERNRSVFLFPSLFDGKHFIFYNYSEI